MYIITQKSICSNNVVATIEQNVQLFYNFNHIPLTYHPQRFFEAQMEKYMFIQHFVTSAWPSVNMLFTISRSSSDSIFVITM